MLLEIKDGTVSRGGTPVLSHFSFEIRGTEKIAIVGRNGAGKTTLLEVLCGERDLDRNEKNPDAGLRKSRAFTVGMLGQFAGEDPEETITSMVVSAGSQNDGEYSEERYVFEQTFIRMFTALGFEKAEMEKPFGSFSGGQQTRIRLIRLLLAQPDVLILDEPTNHLDLEAVQWLENYLRDYRKAVVIVSHDRYFIDRTAEVVWEVTGGKVVRYPGNYTAYREQKLRNYQKQLKAYESQQEEIKRLNDLIETFKHKPRKAAFARSRKKILERMELLEKPERDEAVIRTEEFLPERLGSKWVYECEHLKIGYETPIKEISYRIRRGQKIGILGPNGTGKSTFLKTVAGMLPAISGKANTGVNIDIAYFDQMSAGIDSDQMILEWFHDRFPGMTEKEIRITLAGYLFKGTDLGKPVKNLSGGEKARLVLAALLQRKPNFLILDEPTNNMDIPAKETLESIFKAYKGTILFVSHDRYFLSQVAQSLLVFEAGDAPVLFYPFGYQHYQEKKDAARSGEDLTAIRTAEEQRLIEGMRAVPEPEKHRIRSISTAEGTRDWHFSLNREERHGAEEEFRLACEKLEAVEAGTMNPESLDVYMGYERERARDRWSAALLEWFDLYNEIETLGNEMQ